MMKDWLQRERQFSAFTTGPLLSFWQQRREGEFTGVDNVKIRYVNFCSPRHQRAIVLISGRIESYIKYPEVIYDLYYNGYDVWCMDHRGQGASGRMLNDTNRGHVVKFDDYVDDLSVFIHQIVRPERYNNTYAMAHSMGGAILSLFLAREPGILNAVVLLAPMAGIIFPIPFWLAKRIINWAERSKEKREGYAAGTSHWRPLPFVLNRLTHSRIRYKRFVRFYADMPNIRIGGPTNHWLKESVAAGERMIEAAKTITTPVLLLQASEDKVVDNRAQNRFCQMMAQAGHPCAGGGPQIIEGAYHEILFESDDKRAEALRLILHFFSEHEMKNSDLSHTENSEG